MISTGLPLSPPPEKDSCLADESSDGNMMMKMRMWGKRRSVAVGLVRLFLVLRLVFLQLCS